MFVIGEDQPELEQLLPLRRRGEENVSPTRPGTLASYINDGLEAGRDKCRAPDYVVEWQPAGRRSLSQPSRELMYLT
jgi:hypothetical protein